MAKQFKVEGNYIIITDTVSGVIEIEEPTQDVLFNDDSNNDSITFSHRRGKYLLYNYSFDLVTSTGSVTLTGGASGSVNGITVDSVEIMSGVEAFSTDLSTTAANVAANITAHTSSPNYTATAAGAVITITPVVPINNNTLVVVSNVTTITKTDGNFSGGSSGIVNSSNAEFATRSALKTFLRANTGDTPSI